MNTLFSPNEALSMGLSHRAQRRFLDDLLAQVRSDRRKRNRVGIFTPFNRLRRAGEPE